MTEHPEVFTISEACAASRIGRTKIYDAINEGRLVARKLGKKTLILRGDLLQFLTALPSLKEPRSRKPASEGNPRR